MYENPVGNSLCQGDILAREIVAPVLQGHLDYFAQQEHFIGYCVVTQSCDLANGRCEDFVTLAVMRYIDEAFLRIRFDRWDNAEKRRRMLENIINHDFNKRAYFYLPADNDMGVPEAVVDLRVTFALDSDLHYAKLLEARRVSLSDLYAAKLGWMMGHLFSRVATPDWDDAGLAQTKKAYAKALNDSITQADKTSLKYLFLLNRIAQGIQPLSDALTALQAADSKARAIFWRAIRRMVDPAAPTCENAAEAIAESNLDTACAPCVLLSEGPEPTAINSMCQLPEQEHERTLGLLITLFRIADVRRRKEQECGDTCKHWWHGDLSDPKKLDALASDKW